MGDFLRKQHNLERALVYDPQKLGGLASVFMPQLGDAEKGVGIAQVAEFLGHVDTKMVSRHYSQLSQRVEHLREMAKKANEK